MKIFRGRVKYLRNEVWEYDMPFEEKAPNMATALRQVMRAAEHPILEIKISDPSLKAARKKALNATKRSA